jgi:hypothetical protein
MSGQFGLNTSYKDKRFNKRPGNSKWKQTNDDGNNEGNTGQSKQSNKSQIELPNSKSKLKSKIRDLKRLQVKVFFVFGHFSDFFRLVCF